MLESHVDREGFKNGAIALPLPLDREREYAYRAEPVLTILLPSHATWSSISDQSRDEAA